MPMPMLGLAAAVGLLLLALTRPALGFACVRKLSSCSCVTDRGGHPIDLWSLAPPYPMMPTVWTTTPDKPGQKFEFAPCTPFLCQSQYKAGVCILGWYNQSGVTIGEASSARFVDTLDPYSIILRYNATDMVNGTSVSYQADVTLECRADADVPRFSVNHIFLGRYFNFQLETRLACIGPDPTTTPSPAPIDPGTGGGVSAWVVVMLVLVGLVLVYAVGGVAVKAIVYEARGVELIPNIDLWRAIGRGCQRVRERASEYRSSSGGYDNIQGR